MSIININPNRTLLVDAASRAGVTIEDMTASDAFAHTGLDWTVEVHPTVAVVGDAVLPVGDRRAVVRTEVGKAPVLLGTVGQRFVPYQNRDAWDQTVEVMHGEGWQTAITGSFGNGERVFMQFRTPDVFRATGEQRERFITYTNFHNGKGSGGWNWGSVLIVCSNTFQANVAQAADAIRFEHTVAHTPTPEEVRHALGLAVVADERFEGMIAQLVGIKVDDRELLDVADKVLGGPAVRREFEVGEKGDTAFERARGAHLTRQSTLARIFDGPTVNFGGTGWGALNAISEWQEHHAPGSDEVRARRVLMGDTTPLLRDAAELLLTGV